MTDSNNIVSIKILDRTYRIKCPQDEVSQLQESVHYLDEQMRKIRQSGNINTVEHVAVVAALNIARELMTYKKQNNTYIDIVHEAIQTRIYD